MKEIEEAFSRAVSCSISAGQRFLLFARDVWNSDSEQARQIQKLEKEVAEYEAEMDENKLALDEHEQQLREAMYWQNEAEEKFYGDNRATTFSLNNSDVQNSQDEKRLDEHALNLQDVSVSLIVAQEVLLAEIEKKRQERKQSSMKMGG